MKNAIIAIAFVAGSLSCTVSRPQPSIEEKSIRAAYQRLAEYTSAAGTPVTFELSDFRTLQAPSFAANPLEDIATMPGGDLIDVRREAQFDEARSLAWATYSAQWGSQELSWAETFEGQAWKGLSVGDAFAIVRDQPALDRVAAITTFSVAASLEGKVRRYRASFLWLRESEGDASTSRFRFIALDHITQGVGEAAAETLPAPSFSLSPEHGESLGQSRQALGVCAPQSSPWTDTQWLQNWDYHITGRHYSHGIFSYDCRCDSDCSSTCEVVDIGGLGCQDEGVSWNFCHVMSTSASRSSGRQGSGDVNPAACAAGLGCVEKSCPLCLCIGLSVGVSVLGTSVTFSYTGSPDWTGSLQSNYTCPRCTNCGNCAAYEVCNPNGQCTCDVRQCDQYCAGRGAVDNNSCAGNTCICYQFGGYGGPADEYRLPEYQNPADPGYYGSTWWWWLIPPGMTQTCECYYNAQCQVIGRNPPGCGPCPGRRPPC